MCGMDLSDLGWGPVAGYYEHNSEPLLSTKCRKFLD